MFEHGIHNFIYNLSIAITELRVAAAGGDSGYGALAYVLDNEQLAYVLVNAVAGVMI